MLIQLGLEDKEIAVYMGLLELGEASVLSVSKKTGVKRPTAYLVLEALEKQGLVSRVMKGKKISFTPQHPRKILTEAEIRLKQLKEILPQFEATMMRADNKPRVKIYEGKDALDRAYDEAFVVKGEILFLSNIEVTYEVYMRTLQKFDYTNFSPEFSCRELIVDSEVARTYAKRVARQYRTLRFMPKEYAPFATDIGIFGNNAIVTSGTKEYFCVRIESKEIADAFRAMFEAMWQISRDAESSLSIQK